ncbi:MAG: hypothetical protein AAGD10_02585 [Myxococcota bacterium]
MSSSLWGESQDYYTLIASLPALAPPYVEERPPLSRYALERRLQMLEKQDRAELDVLESAMFFDRLPWTLTSQEVIAQFESSLSRVRSPMLRQVVRWRLGVRSMVSALRHRSAGHGAPSKPFGLEPWAALMRRNWNRQDLGLSHSFPWVLQLESMIRGGRTRDFERLVLQEVWRRLSEQAFLHPFDFEGVALYVLRWDLVHRAALEDEQEAVQRFDELLEDCWKGRSLDLGS